MTGSDETVKSHGMQEDFRAAITWLGHATVLIELDGERLLTDPVLRRRVGPLVRIEGSLRTDMLGSVGCVLLSHLHADHADPPSLREIDRAVTVIAPLGAATWLRRRGMKNVRELSAGEGINFGPLVISATAAIHDGRRQPLGPRADAVGYVLRGTASMYFAGDTDLFDQMADLHGTIDVALLPIWGWGSRLGPGHLDPERAARAAAIIAPSVVIPIHWGTYALSRPARRAPDPLLPAREFSAMCERYAPSVEVKLLAPGERFVL